MSAVEMGGPSACRSRFVCTSGVSMYLTHRELWYPYLEVVDVATIDLDVMLIDEVSQLAWKA